MNNLFFLSYIILGFLSILVGIIATYRSSKKVLSNKNVADAFKYTLYCFYLSLLSGLLLMLLGSISLISNINLILSLILFLCIICLSILAIRRLRMKYSK